MSLISQIMPKEIKEFKVKYIDRVLTTTEIFGVYNLAMQEIDKYSQATVEKGGFDSVEEFKEHIDKLNQIINEIDEKMLDKSLNEQEKEVLAKRKKGFECEKMCCMEVIEQMKRNTEKAINATSISLRINNAEKMDKILLKEAKKDAIIRNALLVTSGLAVATVIGVNVAAVAGVSGITRDVSLVTSLGAMGVSILSCIGMGKMHKRSKDRLIRQENVDKEYIDIQQDVHSLD